MAIARDAKEHFPGSRAGPRQMRSMSVDGVSFDVQSSDPGHSSGKSGCGKSTLRRPAVASHRPDAGDWVFDGDAVDVPHGSASDALRRQVHMVFQYSYASLNPRMPIRDSVAFGPFIRQERPVRCEIARRHAAQSGARPGLFGPLYPHELSAA